MTCRGRVGAHELAMRAPKRPLLASAVQGRILDMTCGVLDGLAPVGQATTAGRGAVCGRTQPIPTYTVEGILRTGRGRPGSYSI